MESVASSFVEIADGRGADALGCVLAVYVLDESVVPKGRKCPLVGALLGTRSGVSKLRAAVVTWSSQNPAAKGRHVWAKGRTHSSPVGGGLVEQHLCSAIRVWSWTGVLDSMCECRAKTCRTNASERSHPSVGVRLGMLSRPVWTASRQTRRGSSTMVSFVQGNSSGNAR